MKLSARDAAAWFRKPDPATVAALIYGEDAMRVATRRQEVIHAIIGPEGEAEMRLTRIPGAELRKDPALLLDAVKAQGFFPGPRVAFVEDATDGLADIVVGALAEWKQGDARIIATAGNLVSRSALRKVFETDKRAVAIVIYNDSPGQAEIADLLGRAGLSQITNDARSVIADLARSLDPGDFRQTVEKLGLYKHGDSTELTVDEVNSCAPQSSEADTDDLLTIVADGQSDRIAAVLRRLYAQGVGPVAICIAGLRHFRTLHMVAADPDGPSQGANRLRRPVFGPRRDAVVRQAGNWGRERLEKALGVLIDTDLQLRSASTAPQHALVERALIRLAMMARR
jgi:DNA polymerase III subunit delta